VTLVTIGEKNRRKMLECRRQLPREQGFTYLGLMVMVLIMGVVLATAGVVWHFAMKREKEQELLFVGNQFRQAIKLYYENAPAQAQRYPAKLEDLLADPRYPSTRRYLRKIYADPITGTTTWGLVKGPNGEILGIRSLSKKEPVKKSNFSSADKQFENKKMYTDWVFMYAPGQYPATLLQTPLN
jgi:type II secretory pathway pseudopilin PulG